MCDFKFEETYIDLEINKLSIVNKEYILNLIDLRERFCFDFDDVWMLCGCANREIALKELFNNNLLNRCTKKYSKFKNNILFLKDKYNVFNDFLNSKRKENIISSTCRDYKIQIEDKKINIDYLTQPMFVSFRLAFYFSKYYLDSVEDYVDLQDNFHNILEEINNETKVLSFKFFKNRFENFEN